MEQVLPCGQRPGGSFRAQLPGGPREIRACRGSATGQQETGRCSRSPWWTVRLLAPSGGVGPAAMPQVRGAHGARDRLTTLPASLGCSALPVSPVCRAGTGGSRPGTATPGSRYRHMSVTRSGGSCGWWRRSRTGARSSRVRRGRAGPRGPVYRRKGQTTLKASYTNHYRRGLIKLLDVLEFRSSNHTHRPVIEALVLVARCAAAGTPRTTRWARGCRCTGRWAGTERRLSTAPTSGAGAGWCAWSTRSSPSRPCATSSSARRSGWSALTSGATRMRTCPRTSPSGARRTTASCASHWTRRSSSTNCASK